jgi:YVTN family beta-propeller protein
MYVTTDQDGGSVAVIETATNTLLATIPVGVDGTFLRVNPTDVEFTPDGAFAYVTNQNPGPAIALIETATSQVTSIPLPTLGGAGSVSVTPDGTHAWVTGSVVGVAVYETASNALVTTLGLPGSRPAFTPDGAFAYMPLLGVSELAVVETATHSVVATIPTGAPRDALITPDGRFAYVASSQAGQSVVETIEIASNTVVASVPVPNSSKPRLALTPDGEFLWVANHSNAVAVIETATNTVVATVPVGDSQGDVAFTPDGGRAYVSLINLGQVVVIDTGGRTVVATINVPDVPEQLAAMPVPATKPGNQKPETVPVKVSAYQDANGNGQFDVGEEREGSLIRIESETAGSLTLSDECLTPCELAVPVMTGFVWQLQEQNWDLVSASRDGSPAEVQVRPPDESDPRTFHGVSLELIAGDPEHVIVFQNHQIVNPDRILTLLEDAWVRQLTGKLETKSGATIDRHFDTAVSNLEAGRFDKVDKALADAEAAIGADEVSDPVLLAYLQLVVDHCQVLLAKLLGA